MYIKELESEFYHFDVDNSYRTSPFKGRNKGGQSGVPHCLKSDRSADLQL